jgi:hypothetical protein
MFALGNNLGLRFVPSNHVTVHFFFLLYKTSVFMAIVCYLSPSYSFRGRHMSPTRPWLGMKTFGNGR